MVRIHTFTIDSEESKTELCEFGDKTDKSPHNIWLHYHKHPYTPIYSLLFGPYRNKVINFCEIGIAGGDSITMWKRYFHKDTKIFAMDNGVAFLEKLAEKKHEHVIPIHIDVTNEEYMKLQLKNLDSQFDIVIDDSDHSVDSQKKIVRRFLPYVKSGGMIIIEDVYRSNSAESYQELLGEELLNQFESVYYIKGEHKNRFSGNWNNDALLVLIKI